MQGLELLQFGMRPTAEFGSALRLWSQYVARSEPSFLETDDDGDTRAGGDVDGIWIEFLRQPERIDVAMMHGDPKIEQGQLTFIDASLDPQDRAASLAEAMIADLAPSSLEVIALLAETTRTRRESLAAMRQRISGIDLNDGVAEVELKLSGRRLSAVVTDLVILQEVAWRNGRRVVASSGGNDNLQTQINVFAVQMRLHTLRQKDPLDEGLRNSLFCELMDRVSAIWQEGKHAF